MAKSTIKDVAMEANVSTATVSRVLNDSGFVSDDIKDRVHLAVKKLNYQPNAIARSLKQDKTYTIGVVIPDITNQYYMTISKAIEDIVQQKGYNLIFCSSHENPKKEDKLLQLLVEQRVDAIVLATAGGCEERVRSIHQAGVPIVLVDRTVEIGDSKLDSVVESNFESAYRLTSYLLQQGHRSIGLVNGLLNVSTGKERYEGFQKALEEFGIQEDENYTFNSTFTREGGMKAVDYFLNFTEKPSAILSLNNEMAFGVLLELTRRGYSVPEDIVIASFGDVEAAQLLQAPGIISVAHKPYEMGERVGDILLKRLNHEEGPFNEIFTPRLQIDAQSVSS
ncbi:LacI family transcriptional regulator [Bacillus paranthracis]|uniref:LacI family DNA-binding transcriptional regulator n=1 Tax=Bacillus paranthracis TaxID=2026186 RepID=A0AAJ1K1N8_9BACI|nr:LacI family DNA-binding transcriptional regulator [Bacillus paranthracis]MDA1585768.1 LacI family DNA-binding transcriptional regulator [Bacillus cereus group sp. TH230-1LC]MDG0946553.1 LacI family DNA-binding transcriptional regulator [Bacillus paranthracis]MDG0951788.1 LacI family DNA-binding transcriptional regulator [Bacillus paranthracis]TBL05858.1 LacI family transcriptional regulator [Bacillus paranthracis]HDR7273426.1 LacI family DNA-binding transcriptional regulator [Bacillus paran